MKNRTPFAVGRLTPRGSLVMVVDSKTAPIRGPWTLRAVVSERGRRVTAA